MQLIGQTLKCDRYSAVSGSDWRQTRQGLRAGKSKPSIAIVDMDQPDLGIGLVDSDGYVAFGANCWTKNVTTTNVVI